MPQMDLTPCVETPQETDWTEQPDEVVLEAALIDLPGALTEWARRRTTRSAEPASPRP